MVFPRSNETEVEECQEENGMDNGAHAADLRRLGKARAQDRHRNAGEVEVEKNPRVYEEGACKELAHVLPWWSPGLPCPQNANGPLGASTSGPSLGRSLEASL